MPTNHVAIADNPSTLPPLGGGNIDIQFDAPGVSLVTKPVLSYRVDPTVVPVQLQIELNGTVIVDENFGSAVKRSLDEIFDTGLLQATGNILRARAAAGSLEISDVIVLYSTV